MEGWVRAVMLSCLRGTSDVALQLQRVAWSLGASSIEKGRALSLHKYVRWLFVRSFQICFTYTCKVLGLGRQTDRQTGIKCRQGWCHPLGHHRSSWVQRHIDVHPGEPGVLPSMSGIAANATGEEHSIRKELPELRYVSYGGEKESPYLPAIRQLISKDLSEPYSIYVYRYFLYQWGHLCFMVRSQLVNEPSLDLTWTVPRL